MGSLAGHFRCHASHDTISELKIRRGTRAIAMHAVRLPGRGACTCDRLAAPPGRAVRPRRTGHPSSAERCAIVPAALFGRREALAAGVTAGLVALPRDAAAAPSFYDFKAFRYEKEESMRQFEGKVLVVLNGARRHAARTTPAPVARTRPPSAGSRRSGVGMTSAARELPSAQDPLRPLPRVRLRAGRFPLQPVRRAGAGHVAGGAGVRVEQVRHGVPRLRQDRSQRTRRSPALPLAP